MGMCVCVCVDVLCVLQCGVHSPYGVFVCHLRLHDPHHHHQGSVCVHFQCVEFHVKTAVPRLGRPHRRGAEPRSNDDSHVPQPGQRHLTAVSWPRRLPGVFGMLVCCCWYWCAYSSCIMFLSHLLLLGVVAGFPGAVCLVLCARHAVWPPLLEQAQAQTGSNNAETLGYHTHTHTHTHTYTRRRRKRAATSSRCTRTPDWAWRPMLRYACVFIRVSVRCSLRWYRVVGCV